MANGRGAVYLWVLWMEISLTQLYLAGRSRRGLEAEAIGPKYIRHLDGELSAAMISTAATAHAVDSFYGSVTSLVEFPPGLREKWRSNRTKRPMQILETLKLAFDVGREASDWTRELPWLFDLRDFAVHHRARPADLVWDAQERTKVASEHSLYNLENANEAAKLAIRIMKTCAARPRPTQPAVESWLPEVRFFVDQIDAMGVRPSRYAL